jgi:hypothetical protein
MMQLSPTKVKEHFGGAYLLHLQGPNRTRNQYHGSSVACTSTLKMEAMCSPERSTDFHHSTRHYIFHDRTLHIGGHAFE